MKHPPQLLTIAEAAKAAGISKRRLQELIAEERVRGVGRYGNQYMLMPNWSVEPRAAGPALSDRVPTAGRRR